MTTQIISNPARVHAFVRERSPVPLSAGMKGIGLLRDDELVAGVLYDGFNGSNIWMHVAAEPGGRWLTRDFLYVAFHYPFEQLGCTRISGWVEADNLEAQRFDEHLGFKHEATLKGAGKNGVDVFIYCMTREDCRYV